MAMQASRWSAPSRAIAWVLIASFLTASCATRNVPPIGAGGQPFKPESDEVSLWKQAEKEEETLTKKAKIYDDPLLDEYLGKIADRRSEEHTSELQSQSNLVCRLLLEKKNTRHR